MSSNLHVDDQDDVLISPAQVAAARLYVAANARDTDDAALLLDALGLGAVLPRTAGGGV